MGLLRKGGLLGLLQFQFAIAGIALAMVCAWIDQPLFSWDWELILLASLAVLAELWPVSLFRRGVRVTLTLPFVVGVAAHAGITEAILVDALASLISAIGIRASQKPKISWNWVGLNVAMAALASSAAGLAWYAAVSLAPSFAPLVGLLPFVFTYVVTNALLVSGVDRMLHSTQFKDSVLQTIQPSLQMVGLYGLVSILVALLVSENLTAWCALTVVPLAALRHAIMARAHLTESYYDTVSALTLMLQRVHPYTLGHVKRVSSIAEEVALQLHMPAKTARLVREAAVLHDIGKIAVDEAVLEKPDRLTDSEFAHVKLHAAFGAQILSQVDEFRQISHWIRHHHERPDGSGYPDQLADIEIPLPSKIIAVVDAFDAMTGGEGEEKRSYREPMTSAEAMAELERCAGTQFDQEVVRVFRKVITEGVA